MLGRLALGVAHAMVDHATGTAHPGDALVAAAKGIRGIFAGAPSIEVLAVQLVAVAATQARLLLQYIGYVGLVQWFSRAPITAGHQSSAAHRLGSRHCLRRLQSIALL